jgi:hypothetical protein
LVTTYDSTIFAFGHFCIVIIIRRLRSGLKNKIIPAGTAIQCLLDKKIFGTKIFHFMFAMQAMTYNSTPKKAEKRPTMAKKIIGYWLYVILKI